MNVDEFVASMPRPQSFWDSYFLGLAQAASAASKDPSTKVGSVIVRPDRSIVSTGYNGFPRGIEDTHERLHDREQKIEHVVHAELNAIITAREDLTGCTIYVWPFPPCSGCSNIIIQARIKRVVAPMPSADQLSRWGDSMKKATDKLEEADVELQLIEMEVA